MSSGQLRQSQVITTYGPGALLDLPDQAVIVAGLDTWPPPQNLRQITDERLSAWLGVLTDVVSPRMYAPPSDPVELWRNAPGIGAWSFPDWFVVQERDLGHGSKAATGTPASRAGKRGRGSSRSRRLVHRKSLDQSKRPRFEGRPVVPTRFVRACTSGHVDDLDWIGFVHRGSYDCRRQLWLDQTGTTGDLYELSVRCECGESRRLYEAADRSLNALGGCRGRRPWLGLNTEEECDQSARLLIRTASNAYFSQVVSALSLPDHGSAIDLAVRSMWADLEIVDEAFELAFMKKKPHIATALAGLSDADVMAAIERHKSGADDNKSVKQAELEALLAAKEGFGDDIPVDPDFHVRRVPDSLWRGNLRVAKGIEAVMQLHRLREVQALIGFTRFEAATRDINGDYDTDVARAALSEEPSWFPAVENRGEGLFLLLRQTEVSRWLSRDGVAARLDQLLRQHQVWQKERRRKRDFPGGPYILLHTLAHLLIGSLAMRCGYPASSIRERVYVTEEHCGVLLYTASTGAEGTLGGLVQQARSITDHLWNALEMGRLCSNDPICAHHDSTSGVEQRHLHGAACHGCALIAETSCEMHNDYLDRALVVPILGVADAAFFSAR